MLLDGLNSPKTKNGCLMIKYLKDRLVKGKTDNGLHQNEKNFFVEDPMKVMKKPGMVPLIYNSSTWKFEAGGLP